VVALMLLLAITGAAVAQYTTGRGLIPIAWLSVGPLLASLVLPPWSTALRNPHRATALAPSGSCSPPR
jgi:hypothetical protein